MRRRYGTEVTDLRRRLRQDLGERLLHEVVGLDVPPADHRREPPERLVLRPQRLESSAHPSDLRPSSPSCPRLSCPSNEQTLEQPLYVTAILKKFFGSELRGRDSNSQPIGLTGRLLCRLSYPGMAPEVSSARTRPMTSRCVREQQ